MGRFHGGAVMSGIIDCLCLVSFAVIGFTTVYRIDAAARRARKD